MGTVQIPLHLLQDGFSKKKLGLKGRFRFRFRLSFLKRALLLFQSLQNLQIYNTVLPGKKKIAQYIYYKKQTKNYKT